jgi:hypothetical protein
MTIDPSRDLPLARVMLDTDDFIEGRLGLEADAKPNDPGVVNVHLNGEVAEALLAARGFRRGDDHRWYAPDGDSSHRHRDEALTLALTAEVAGAPEPGT